jgi:UDP-N-acetylglucosamine 2-epimerase (non-hydrolysing)
MKIAPFIRAIDSHNLKNGNVLEHLLVHTGQHYDIRMSDSFFHELSIPQPDINLEIGSGSHAEQLGNTMIAFEKVLIDYRPDWVVVVGDVNATLSCSVAAKRLGIKVCHIEAGLRSGDMSMPEEINRLVTDRISDLLLTPDLISSANLKREGTPDDKIEFVGNIMIDTLESNREKAASLNLNDIILRNQFLTCHLNSVFHPSQPYALMTIHRPSNVDNKEVIEAIIEFLINEVSNDLTLIWPIHPRTKKQLETFGLLDKIAERKSFILLEPLGYNEMVRLNMDAKIILTDSGGVQEECCVLGTPCLTLRWNTERPVTLRENGGASVLVGNNIDRIREEYYKTLDLERSPKRPEQWDGRTAERCLRAILAKSQGSLTQLT